MELQCIVCVQNIQDTSLPEFIVGEREEGEEGREREREREKRERKGERGRERKRERERERERKGERGSSFCCISYSSAV